MTAINETTPKRKHAEMKTGDVVVVGRDDAKPEKKLAMESLDEITLTPIPKILDDKTTP